jgi:hypothetical protein
LEGSWGVGKERHESPHGFGLRDGVTLHGRAVSTPLGFLQPDVKDAGRFRLHLVSTYRHDKTLAGESFLVNHKYRVQKGLRCDGITIVIFHCKSYCRNAFA